MAQWLRALARVQHTHRMVCYGLQPSSTLQRQLHSCDTQHTRAHTWKYDLEKENDDKFKLNHVQSEFILYIYIYIYIKEEQEALPSLADEEVVLEMYSEPSLVSGMHFLLKNI